MIFLAILIVAIYVFVGVIIGKIFKKTADTIDDTVNIGKSLVDSALNDAGVDMNKLKEGVESGVSSVANSINNSNEKTAITADKFSEIMKGKGYEVIETTASFAAEKEDYVKKSYLARNKNYQIEFYELSGISNAIDSYNINKAKFENQKGSSSSYSTLNKDNYSMYALTTNGKYQYIARIDNTNLYADVDEMYKDEVKNIINELGY